MQHLLPNRIDEAFPRNTTTRKPGMSPEGEGNGPLRSNRRHRPFGGQPGTVKSWRPGSRDHVARFHSYFCFEVKYIPGLFHCQGARTLVNRRSRGLDPVNAALVSSHPNTAKLSTCGGYVLGISITKHIITNDDGDSKNNLLEISTELSIVVAQLFAAL
jgi:hypothetical protein